MHRWDSWIETVHVYRTIVQHVMAALFLSHLHDVLCWFVTFSTHERFDAFLICFFRFLFFIFVLIAQLSKTDREIENSHNPRQTMIAAVAIVAIEP